ncbi:futalosine hydrolase [Nodularia spumigena]|uniref:futalosine hydrolase n=1 Tax=Nodularia spumigena TaxID=70799 RepID=UPI002B21FA9E|nr:futalosine hydrolase [Nodularia spumigena]MEA5557667.1 futalosine hydrolase [Nodularia spumigena CH309]
MVATDTEATPVLRGLCRYNSMESGIGEARLGGDGDRPLPLWTPVRLSDRVRIIRSGVGKANGAGATTYALASLVPKLVLSIGLAGLLPGSDPGLRLGGLASVRRASFADEGITTPRGFIPMEQAGFPIVCTEGEHLAAAPEALRIGADLCGYQADLATVSTCSGTDAASGATASRAGAALEDMETAAVALACFRADVPWCGVRAISNTTGDRETQIWRAADALASIERVIGPLTETLCRSVGS